MNVLAPLITIIALLVALYLCEWQVIAAFFVAVVAVPIILVFLTHLYEVGVQHQPMNLKEAFEMGSFFSLAGVFIYFPLILPVYYVLKSAVNFPILYSFPFGVCIIILALFALMATKPWGYKEFLMIVACSMLHAFFILWLISKFKSIGF